MIHSQIQKKIERSKRREIHHIQEHPHKGISGFTGRNLTAKERLGWYSTERKITANQEYCIWQNYT